MSDKRKELRRQFKERRMSGGVYRIVNAKTGQYLLQWSDDIQGAHNFMDFCKMTDSCTQPHLQQAWRLYGKDAFSLEELELLEQGEAQTREAFQEDLRVLFGLWEEKLGSANTFVAEPAQR